MSWFQNRELFLSLLEEGEQFEAVIGAKFLGYGLPVVPGDRMYDQNYKPGHKPNDVDIWVGSPKGFLVECKSRAIEFTGIDDYPYDSVFVMSRSKWHQYSTQMRPDFVALISQKTGAVICCPVTATRNQWEEVEVKDSRRGTEFIALSAAKSLWVPFRDVANFIRRSNGLSDVRPLDSKTA